MDKTAELTHKYPRSIKRIIAHQIERSLLKQNLSKQDLANKMQTSRSAINRILDPNNHSITLQTLEKVSEVLDMRLEIYFKE